ncbi:hypothetical protein BGAL_0033g00420 [Botrytis galanthina]|uniref:Uncharacterized protein n=1 Tax=Botrytis galanthina TaxID=278940 RepID=A0A4S8RHR2_9HELO|nr:hypothetical protein BGAL_0033g00420 [Botrytis galanthina]
MMIGLGMYVWMEMDKRAFEGEEFEEILLCVRVARGRRQKANQYQTETTNASFPYRLSNTFN